jgi:guanylate kinase
MATTKQKRGLLIVFSGPSGCGKGTIVSQILAKRADTALSVSITTRDPRPGEIDGVHYYFINRERAEEMIRSGEMLEHAEYNGNYYGTPRAAVEAQLEAGINVILEIEVQGALQVMERVPDHVSVFLAVPSMDELERRLRNRGTETEASVQRRLAAAEFELQHACDYQYLVLNDDISAAVERLNTIIEAENLRYSRMKTIMEEY